jgi:hypothetical protein
MINEQIAQAIRATTGPGNEKPYLFRIVSYLTAFTGGYMGLYDEVFTYFVDNRIACIPVLSYPKTAMKGDQVYR